MDLNLDNMQRYIETAHALGCPRDQVENFIRGAYVAQPHQLAFHAAARLADDPNGPTDIATGGARGPGKSHAVLAQIGLDDCIRMPQLKCLYLRKVQKAAKESFEDMRRRVFATTPHSYNRNEGILCISATDSRIVIGHFKDEKDIDNYLGIEYDIIAVEEASTLTETKINAVKGSLRTSKPGWRPRQYNTTNPGGVGHQYFRRRFILPWREGRETDTRFIPGTARDNKLINAEYARYLAGLTGTLGKMWRDGDWDVAGGQFFTTFSHERHVAASIRVQPHWRVWLAMDYGYTHFTVIYLFAQDDDGHVYIVDEHAERRWLIERHAAAVFAILERHGLTVDDLSTFVAGHDCFVSRDDTGATIADKWQAHGFTLTPATIDRINGAAQWLQRLGDPLTEPPIPPTITISQACPLLLECLPAMLSDPRRPEDVLKVDCDEDGNGGDDPYDASRYGLMEAERAAIYVTPAAGPARSYPSIHSRGLR